MTHREKAEEIAGEFLARPDVRITDGVYFLFNHSAIK